MGRLKFGVLPTVVSCFYLRGTAAGSTPSCKTLFTGCSVHAAEPMKEKLPCSPTFRPGSSCKPRTPTRSKANATAPSSPSSSTTPCAAPNCAACASRTTPNDAASKICVSTARAERSVTCQCIRRRRDNWRNTSTQQVIAPSRMAHSSDVSVADEIRRPLGSCPDPSIATLSCTAPRSSASSWNSWDRTRCARPPPPTPSTTERHRQGSGMARTLEHLHHAPLRPAEDTPRRLPHLQSRILRTTERDTIITDARSPERLREAV